MRAVVFFNGGLRAPPIIAIKPPTRFKSIIFSKEIADGASLFSFQVDTCQLPRPGIRCEASRKGRPRRRVPSDDTPNRVPSDDTPKDVNDESKGAPPSGGEKPKASSQKEIIDLFRRIHSSISNGSVPRKKNSRNSNMRNPNEKQTEGTLGSSKHTSRKKKEADDELVKMALEKTDVSDVVEAAPLAEDLGPTRPTSKFVKRSPIPSSPPMEEDIKGKPEAQKIHEKATEELRSETAVKDSEVQKIEDMKLTELKELARAKGIKGYSKMKKGELLKVLKGVMY